MKKEVIKKIGIKDFLIWQSLWILEIIINLPYIVIRSLLIIIDDIFEAFEKIFYKIIDFCCPDIRIVKLRKLNKKIDKTARRIIQKMKNNKKYEVK